MRSSSLCQILRRAGIFGASSGKVSARFCVIETLRRALVGRGEALDDREPRDKVCRHTTLASSVPEFLQELLHPRTAAGAGSRRVFEDHDIRPVLIKEFLKPGDGAGFLLAR